MTHEDEVGLWTIGIIGILLVILIGSFWYSYSDSDVKEEPKNEKTNTVEVPKYNPNVLAYIGPFMKVEIEGHWYLAGIGCRTINHMPSCPCYNKEKKDEYC